MINEVDLTWNETFASTPTVRNVAGKDVDIRWAWSNGAIPVWDENADGSKSEVHPSVFAIENIEQPFESNINFGNLFLEILAFANLALLNVLIYQML